MKNRICLIRSRNDLSQNQLADILGITQKTLSNYETNKTEIPSDILFKLSEIFNVSIDYILYNDKRKETITKFEEEIEQYNKALQDMFK